MIEFLAVFLVCYVYHALGITIGYHRMLSHRAFATPKWVEYFWVLAGYLAFEGSPIWWCTIHRAHHRHVDTPLDPHSPRHGLQNAWFGWLTEKGYAPHVSPERQAKDLLKDPIYRFLEFGGSWAKAHTFTFTVGFLFRAAIWAYFGWVPALASLLAGLAVLQIPLMLNVICHIPKFGYKSYAVEDDSVNVWWVGLLACGEGWHNNHHASPSSAKTGMHTWKEFDLSWQLIKVMRSLGLATRVNEFNHEEMVRKAEIVRKSAALRLQTAPTVLPTVGTESINSEVDCTPGGGNEALEAALAASAHRPARAVAKAS